MKRVLIIGSTGFLGGALKKYLPSEKFEIHTLDRVHTKQSSSNPGSLGSKEFEEAISQFHFEAVIVCNWDGVPKRYRNDWQKQQANVDRIEDYLRISIRGAVQTFIALGSQAEGDQSQEPIPEQVLESNSTAYSKAKTTLSKNLFDIAEDSSTRVLWARVFSVYGPGDHEDSVVSTCISAFHKNRLNTINYPDLDWSFLYVSDFVSAIDTLLSQPDLKGVVNVANSHMEKLGSLNDYLSQIKPSIQGEVSSLAKAESPSQPLIPVVEKLENAGWFPKISLKEGIEKTL
jgi:nucleoside-diphosphate-sugar epimerase